MVSVVGGKELYESVYPVVLDSGRIRFVVALAWERQWEGKFDGRYGKAGSLLRCTCFYPSFWFTTIPFRRHSYFVHAQHSISTYTLFYMAERGGVTVKTRHGSSISEEASVPVISLIFFDAHPFCCSTPGQHT